MGNVKTHTLAVHVGRFDTVKGFDVPACMSRTQIGNLHYAVPTTEEVTCKKCASGAKSVVKPVKSPVSAPKAIVGQESVSLAFVAENGIQAVRIATPGMETVWTLHQNGESPFYVALTLKDAKRVAGSY